MTTQNKLAQRCAMGCTIAAAIVASPSQAAPARHQFGDPVPIGDGFAIDPIVEGRLRYEHVDQPGIDADAVTVRLRAGAELQYNPAHLAVLVEGEGTLGLGNRYNAYPYVPAMPSSQRRPRFSVVPDPQNVELNRIQLQYRTRALTVTIGRQRINLDDQRWVGSVAWRQNEQTFDAIRGEAKLGAVQLDGTYARRQHTIFGEDAAPRTSFAGNFGFLGAATKVGPVNLKAFAYLLDYEGPAQAGVLAIANADTQTYGLRATTTLPLSPKVKLALMASYARQSDFQQNRERYGVDYFAGEAGLGYAGFTLTGGYEELGSARTASGARRSLETPMATLHKFNGWADLFLVTPPNGLRDGYVSLAKAFPKLKAVPGLNAAVVYHRFTSDFGGQHYGNEIDASLGFKIRKVAFLAKYADYDARAFGADKRILWLQAEFAY